MPFALILEDRVDVWEPAVKNQILTIEPYDPYREHAETMVQMIDSEKPLSGSQMDRAGDIIVRLREEMLARIDSLRASFDDVTLCGAIELNRPEESYAELAAPPPWVEHLLPRLQQEVSAVPSLPPYDLAAAQAMRAGPSALQAPRDPRLAYMRPRSADSAPAPAPVVRHTSAAADSLMAARWVAAFQQESPHGKEQQDRFKHRNAMLVDHRVVRGEEFIENGRNTIDMSSRNPRVEVEEPSHELGDPVVLLSQAAQKSKAHLVYEIERSTGKGFLGDWRVQAKLGRAEMGWAIGPSKEAARIVAAKKALEALGLREPTAAAAAALTGKDDARERERENKINMTDRKGSQRSLDRAREWNSRHESGRKQKRERDRSRSRERRGGDDRGRKRDCIESRRDLRVDLRTQDHGPHRETDFCDGPWSGLGGWNKIKKPPLLNSNPSRSPSKPCGVSVAPREGISHGEVLTAKIMQKYIKEHGPTNLSILGQFLSSHVNRPSKSIKLKTVVLDRKDIFEFDSERLEVSLKK